ncbi:MAG: TonB-dependent receptor [Candidatus Eisenbacteria bacterium]
MRRMIGPLAANLVLGTLLALILAAAAAVPAFAQSTGLGTIEGTVSDNTGKPLPYANVVILGTQWGAMTVEDGSYSIKNIPPGQYTIRVLMIGYEQKDVEGVNVTPDQTVPVNFNIADKPVGTLNEVEIVAERERIKTKRTDTSHDITSDDLESLPVNEIAEAVGLKAGVIARGGELHFRGGRAGEINVTVDGVPVKDPLLGGGASLATLAVESTETILGGLDAEYGNAQSGVINFTTKEGGREFEGEIYYLTDDYGQPDNTYDNLDRLFVGVGGPSPLKDLTYYLSAEGTFSDDYPATPRDRPRHKVLNLISLGDRKSNQIRVQSKLAYKIGSNMKITGEFIHNNSRSDTYYHMWSRVGYVQTFRDTTQTGDVVVRHGRWAPTQVDSTYEYFNAANHTPNNLNRFTQMKAVLNHTIDQSSYYSLKLSRNFFYLDQRVGNKKAWEYLGDRQTDLWFNYSDRESEPYFVIAGDFPTLSHRETIVYTAKGDYTKRYKNHTFKTGFESGYNDMKYYQVDRPFQTASNGEIGTRTRYHYYNPEGAMYLQDRWEHEGMVLNLGLRYDVFSVGDQLPISEVRQRVKQQVSPRVGIAYPISDRDVFSFHYGRFYQIPERQYLFDNRGVLDGRTQGNPNLTNETTVSYQAGIQHLFSDLVAGQFSVYYKDIFGLLTTEQRASFGNVSNVTSYVNKDYASARGFEATLSVVSRTTSPASSTTDSGSPRASLPIPTRSPSRTSRTCRSPSRLWTRTCGTPSGSTRPSRSPAPGAPPSSGNTRAASLTRRTAATPDRSSRKTSTRGVCRARPPRHPGREVLPALGRTLQSVPAESERARHEEHHQPRRKLAPSVRFRRQLVRHLLRGDRPGRWRVRGRRPRQRRQRRLGPAARSSRVRRSTQHPHGNLLHVLIDLEEHAPGHGGWMCLRKEGNVFASNRWSLVRILGMGALVATLAAPFQTVRADEEYNPYGTPGGKYGGSSPVRDFRAQHLLSQCRVARALRLQHRTSGERSAQPGRVLGGLAGRGVSLHRRHVDRRHRQ